MVLKQNFGLVAALRPMSSLGSPNHRQGVDSLLALALKRRNHLVRMLRDRLQTKSGQGPAQGTLLVYLVLCVEARFQPHGQHGQRRSLDHWMSGADERRPWRFGEALQEFVVAQVGPRRRGQLQLIQ